MQSVEVGSSPFYAREFIREVHILEAMSPSEGVTAVKAMGEILTPLVPVAPALSSHQ